MSVKQPIICKELIKDEVVIEERDDGKKYEISRKTYRNKKPLASQLKGLQERRNVKWSFENESKLGVPARDASKAVELLDKLTKLIIVSTNTGTGENEIARKMEQLRQSKSENGEPKLFQVSTVSDQPSQFTTNAWRPSTVTLTNFSLKVSNLPKDVSFEVLKDYMTDRFGRETIHKVNLVKNRQGESTGFGFVTFTTFNQAETALTALLERPPSMFRHVLDFEWANN